MTRRRIGKITLRFGIIISSLTIVVALGLARLIGDRLVAWFLTITLVTFLTYGYDKAIAGSDTMRVPETILLTLAILGGTFGAIAGMRFFRHKTSKESFRFRFYLIVIAQVIALLTYYTLLKR